MNLTRAEIINRVETWLTAWKEYDLQAVLDFMHPNVVFENWDGLTVIGKTDLQKLWLPWFIFNKNFKFITETIFVDEQEQKIAFQWKYEGASFLKEYKHQHEVRRGTDIMYLENGKISEKYSYSKTIIEIDGQPIGLSATK